MGFNASQVKHSQRITLSIEKKMGVYEVFCHKMRKRKGKGENCGDSRACKWDEENQKPK